MDCPSSNRKWSAQGLHFLTTPPGPTPTGNVVTFPDLVACSPQTDQSQVGEDSGGTSSLSPSYETGNNFYFLSAPLFMKSSKDIGQVIKGQGYWSVPQRAVLRTHVCLLFGWVLSQGSIHWRDNSPLDVLSQQITCLAWLTKNHSSSTFLPRPTSPPKTTQDV